MFTVNPHPGTKPDAEVPANQRVIRVDGNFCNSLESLNRNVEVGGVHGAYRANILGGGTNDGVPICFNTHAVGSLVFGQDASLMISGGEGAHWNFDMGDF